MDENATIKLGKSMTITNSIETLHIYYERLESEPDARVIAQRKRRSLETALKRKTQGVRLFIASLIASHKIS